MANSDHRRCFRCVAKVNSIRNGCLTRWKDLEAGLCIKKSIQHLPHFDFECFAIAAVRAAPSGLEVWDVDRCGLLMGYWLHGKCCRVCKGSLVNRSLERLAACGWLEYSLP